MRISLNLASRPFTDLGPALKRLRIGMGILAGLSLLLLLGLHAVHRKAEEARAVDHSLDGDISRINTEREGYHALMQRPDNARFLEQVVLLNQLFDQKAFSWTLAMENLETVLPAGVQVTQIEPTRDKNGKITLHLRVLGPHNLSDDLVRNLEHSHRFISPRIEGENAETGNSGSNRSLEPVSASNKFQFDLQVDYVPPTPEERGAAKNSTRMNEAAGDESHNQPGNLPPASRHVPAGNPVQPRQPYTGASRNSASPSRPNPAGYPNGRNANPPGGPQ